MKSVVEIGYDDSLKGSTELGSTFFQQLATGFYLFLRYTFLIFLLFLLASHEAANPRLGRTDIEFYSVAFRNGILNQKSFTISDSDQKMESSMRHFYAIRNYSPAWTVNFDIQPSYREFEELIANSYQFGLLPSLYQYSQLKNLEQAIRMTDKEEDKLVYRIEFELAATEALLLFSEHLAVGINRIDTSDTYRSYIEQLPGFLNLQLKNETLREGILSLQPQNKPYSRLQHALAKYMISAGADTVKYTSEEIKHSMELQANRLILQGFLDRSFAGDSAAVHSALRNFQRAHGLEVTGKMNRETTELLSKSTQEKFYKIALNLDRIRKDNLKNSNYILVNIPEFRLQYYNTRGKCTEFNVIVGKEDTPTPMLTSNVEMIVTNPHWTVPQSISRNELIPLIKKDSTYLQKHGFTVVDNKNKPVEASSINWSELNPQKFNYWFRQTTTNNALGVVKFLFPNEYAVYLHDTQSKRLFNTTKRAYSHGCIRLQDPIEFAKILVSSYIVNNENIDIETIIRKKDRQQIKLDNPLPIYIRYYSCSADSLGNIHFLPDIYGMDEEAMEQLFANTSWN